MKKLTAESDLRSLLLIRRHRLYTTSEIMGCKPQERPGGGTFLYIAMLTVILIIAFIPQVTMFLLNLSIDKNRIIGHVIPS